MEKKGLRFEWSYHWFLWWVLRRVTKVSRGRFRSWVIARTLRHGLATKHGQETLAELHI